jgi:hypothetical protein
MFYIPATIRAAAIEALELAASNYHSLGSAGWPPTADQIYAISEDYDRNETRPIVRLMQLAWSRVIGTDAESLAGAAALLRDGWSPGEVTYQLIHEYPGTPQHRVIEKLIDV